MSDDLLDDEEPLDHDQRFKELLKEFFAEFLNLFFTEWAAKFDLTQVEWLDGELFPNPPGGTKHLVDLVAKLNTFQPIETGSGPASQMLALVHVEIESATRTTSLKPRFPRYYNQLRDRYGLPVLPIALFLKVGLNGIGEDFTVERFDELEVLRFRYLYVGLPGLDAEPYLHGTNPLGVALSALMRIPKDQIAAWGIEALTKICNTPMGEQRRDLLADCVLTYGELDPQYEEMVFETIVKNIRPQGGIMSSPFTRIYQKVKEHERKEGIQEGQQIGQQIGRIEGQQIGRREGLRQVAEAQVRVKFGPLTTPQTEFLAGRNEEELLAMSLSILTATTIEELGFPHD